MSFLEKGYLNISDVVAPPEERFSKGSVAVIECVQRIPCNPCVDSCPRKAITMGDSINNVPVIDFNLCNGCGICVANCPGLAIFLIDKTFSEEQALLGMPYEFTPLPEADEEVDTLDRTGTVCGTARVVKVRNAKAQDRTPIVFMAVPKDEAMNIRFFKRRGQ